MKILLAVDGSPYTKKMLAYLTTHEELTTGTHTYGAITVQSALPPRARAALGKETVEAYLVFMQNRDKLGDILAAAHFDRATKSMERYRSARSASVCCVIPASPV